MENFKISIPTPCHEDWQQMTPQDKGRFCSSCSKIVVDFSVMTEGEIIHFFKNHQNEKVCGHIKKTQLEKIYEPKNFLEKHYKYIHQAYKSSWLGNVYLGILSSLLLLTGCQKEEKVGDVEAIKTEVKKDSVLKCTKDSLHSNNTVEGELKVENEVLDGNVDISFPEDDIKTAPESITISTDSLSKSPNHIPPR